MDLLNRFLERTEFESYEDFKKNYKLNIPENFNFGYDIVDEYARSFISGDIPRNHSPPGFLKFSFSKFQEIGGLHICMLTTKRLV